MLLFSVRFEQSTYSYVDIVHIHYVQLGGGVVDSLVAARVPKLQVPATAHRHHLLPLLSVGILCATAHPGLRFTKSMTIWADAKPVSFSGNFVISHAPFMERRIICSHPRHFFRNDPTHHHRMYSISSMNSINAGRMIVFAPVRMASTNNVFDGDASGVNTSGNELDCKAKQYGFKPPAHSESFLLHLESVKSSWPHLSDSIDEEADAYLLNDKLDNTRYLNDEGVRCAGEPTIDPSRMLQSVVDGESDWI